MIQLDPALAKHLIPLQLLTRGQIAEIGQIVGKPDHVHRLQELGMNAGTVVEMVQPGSPCIVRLSGQKLCFRESDTMGIFVRVGAWD